MPRMILTSLACASLLAVPASAVDDDDIAEGAAVLPDSLQGTYGRTKRACREIVAEHRPDAALRTDALVHPNAGLWVGQDVRFHQGPRER